MEGIYREIIILLILAYLGVQTHFRVRKQESGWERLLASSAAQVSNLQKGLTEALRHNVELQQALQKARAEAVRCPYPHPHTEQVDIKPPTAGSGWEM